MKKLLVILLLLASVANATPIKVFFLHRSTGENLLAEGDVRSILYDLNFHIQLWDLNANNPNGYIRDTLGNLRAINYGIYGTDISDNDLLNLWTTENASKDSLLTYDVIAFKSCYDNNAAITSDAMLQSYKDKYTQILDVLHSYPNKKFIIMGYPPIRENFPVYGYTAECAVRSIDFNTWLDSRCTGNLYSFNIFFELCTEEGFLRPEYCRTSSIDTHPNQIANIAVGIDFALFIASVCNEASAVPLEEDPIVPFSYIKYLYR